MLAGPDNHIISNIQYMMTFRINDKPEYFTKFLKLFIKSYPVRPGRTIEERKDPSSASINKNFSDNIDIHY